MRYAESRRGSPQRNPAVKQAAYFTHRVITALREVRLLFYEELHDIRSADAPLQQAALCGLTYQFVDACAAHAVRNLCQRGSVDF